MTSKLPLENGDTAQAMDTVWDALHSYKEMAEMLRDHLGVEDYDGYFDGIKSAMALIQEVLDEQSRNHP